jgi:hypothetical protein
MKKSLKYCALLCLTAVLIEATTSCNKTENPIKFPRGTFPDSLIILSDINSVYDDYNSDINVLAAGSSLIFSSNRGSSGGQYDLVYGDFSYVFNQETGDFNLKTEITNNPFLNSLVLKANTTGNDFGPYSLFSAIDGFEYNIISSVNSNGNLDFYYLKHLPFFGTSVPEISGPFPVGILNSSSDDAYICFDTNQDSAYFTSNAEGNFDIYLHLKPAEQTMDEWFNRIFESSPKAEIINSTSDDKCPFIFRKIMVFASDRPGGLGGFDLYYSRFSDGEWGTPVNFGPEINSSSDEYRPVISSDEEFTNNFMIFSSNRPGGKGGYDLYFTGLTFVD